MDQGERALAAVSESRRPIYYGWWVLAAAAVTEMLAIGSISYASGLFVVPLERELSLSRAAASSAIPIAFAGGALMAPIVGYLLDRISISWVLIIGVLSLCLGFVAIAATSSLTVMAAALFVLVGFGGMAVGPLTTSTLASRWFYKRRGRALGVAAVATSGGGILVVPLLSLAIEAYGWRSALTMKRC
jgi:MFS family permease